MKNAPRSSGNIIEKALAFVGLQRVPTRRALNRGESSIWSTLSPSRRFALPPENLDFPHAFRLIPAVHFCIDLLQTQVAALPLEFYIRTGGGERTKIERRPGNVVDLWGTANTEETGHMLMLQLVGSLLMQGNGFLFMDGMGTARPQALWVLDPLQCNPVPMRDNPRIVSHYEVNRVVVPREQVVHFRGYSPDHGLLGLSPLTALQLAYETDRDSSRFRRMFFAKGGGVSGHYSTENALDEAGVEELRNELRERFSGPDKAWEPVLLPRSLKYERSGLTFSEMQFVETARLDLDDILRVYKIPPMIAGIADGAGLNSDVARVANLMLYQNAVAPLLALIKTTVTEVMLSRGMFGPNLEAEFDTSGVLALQQVWLEQASAYQIATGAPIMTRAEARERLGLEELDDKEAEKLLVPLGMMTDDAKEERAANAPDMTPKSGSEMDPEEDPTEDPATEDTQGRAAQGGNGHHFDRDGAKKRDRLRVVADRALRPHERRMERGFRRIFTRQEALSVERLAEQVRTVGEGADDGSEFMKAWRAARTRAVNVDDLLHDDEADRKLVERLIRAIVEERGAQALAELGLDLAFDISSRERRAWIREKATKAITQVNETTRDRLRDTLAEGEGAGEGLAELTARVREVFGGRRDNSPTIARTETSGAYSYATTEAWSDSGVVESKEWLTAHDDVVRDTHAAADGQVVALDAQFRVGSDLLDFPGDPSGSAEEIINCRCTLIPVLTPAGDAQQEKAPGANRLREFFENGKAHTNGHSKPSPELVAFLSGGKK